MTRDELIAAADAMDVDRTKSELLFVIHEAAAMLRADESQLAEANHVIEKALIWSAYQHDDSLRDQAKNPWLRSQAEEAALQLFQAVDGLPRNSGE